MTPARNNPSCQLDDMDRARHIGSFEHDRAGRYTLQWQSASEMEKWKRQEEEIKSIEFIRSDSKLPGVSAPYWSTKMTYICSRARSGGKSKYRKKQNAQRAIPSKKLEQGCPCRLTIKTYPNTPVVLGVYNDEHSHELGEANAIFTRFRKERQKRIKKRVNKRKELCEAVQTGVNEEGHSEEQILTDPSTSVPSISTVGTLSALTFPRVFPSPFPAFAATNVQIPTQLQDQGAAEFAPSATSFSAHGSLMSLNSGNAFGFDNGFSSYDLGYIIGQRQPPIQETQMHYSHPAAFAPPAVDFSDLTYQDTLNRYMLSRF